MSCSTKSSDVKNKYGVILCLLRFVYKNTFRVYQLLDGVQINPSHWGFEFSTAGSSFLNSEMDA